MLPTILLTGLMATSGVLATSGVSELPAVQAPASWASNLTAVWSLDEASGTRVNSGSCGSACDLSTISGTPPGGTNRMEGSRAIEFNAGTLESVSCTDANCGSALGPASSGGLGGDVTYGCWMKIGWFDQNLMTRRSANGFIFDYTVNDGGGAYCKIDSTSTALVTGIWADYHHVVCRFDDTNNDLDMFHDAAVVASAAPTSITAVSTTFQLRGITLSRLDECFVHRGALTDKDICRICSCGIDGSLCSYYSATDAWAGTGRNATWCGSCALPTSPSAAMGAS